jgi:hypothetical protein
MPQPPVSKGASCTHLHLDRKFTKNAQGNTTDNWWECTNCGEHFTITPRVEE